MSSFGLNKVNNFIFKPLSFKDLAHLRVWMEFASERINNFNIIVKIYEI